MLRISPRSSSQRQSFPSAENDLGVRPLLARLIGLENEYAVRISVPDAQRLKGLDAEHVWSLLRETLASTTQTFVAGGSLKHAVFLENGGAFNFEGFRDGPIEGQTPECRGAAQTLLYQRAQEALLLEALPRVEQHLREETRLDVEIGLIRNARDAQGNLYGPQENYEVEVAGPVGLLFIRALAILGGLWMAPLYLVLTLLLIAGMLAAMIAVRLIDRFVDRGQGRLAARFETFMTTPHEIERSWLWLYLLPGMAWCYLVLGRLVHWRARRDLLPHLVSRIAVVGTGALLDDGRFALSERAPFVGAVVTRVGPEAVVRSLFELGHIFKAHLVFPADPKLFPRVLRRRQRLQLSSSEASRAQVAELLKIGTTALVLDLSDRKLLEDAPRLRDPIAALHAIALDPTLTTKVALCDGRMLSALEIQRWYQQRAAECVARHEVVNLEARQIVKLWADALDALARDPRELVGVLDWPTKKALLDASTDLSLDARKKIAIRYHELGAGYFERFERRGAAVELVTREDIERAKTTPPIGTPAFARGHAIKNSLYMPLRYVSWERILHENIVPKRNRLRLVDDDDSS